MEKTISEIVDYALSKTKDFSNCDRYTTLDKVSERLWQEAADVQKPCTGASLEQHVVVRRKVYLSGPISGYDYEERRITFGLWNTVMRAHGFEPVNPMENGVPKDAPSEEHMRVDLMMLLKCDCIMMLKGWERSLGARLEHEVALSCGMRVMNESDPSMRDFLNTSWTYRTMNNIHKIPQILKQQC